MMTGHATPATLHDSLSTGVADHANHIFDNFDDFDNTCSYFFYMARYSPNRGAWGPAGRGRGCEDWDAASDTLFHRPIIIAGIL